MIELAPVIFFFLSIGYSFKSNAFPFFQKIGIEVDQRRDSWGVTFKTMRQAMQELNTEEHKLELKGLMRDRWILIIFLFLSISSMLYINIRAGMVD